MSTQQQPKQEEIPKTPADPRPDNEPYYIGSECEDCGTDLVLEDKYRNEYVPEEEIWHDTWICPNTDCPKNDYVVLDAPDGYIERFIDRAEEAIENGETFTLEEIGDRQWT